MDSKTLTAQISPTVKDMTNKSPNSNSSFLIQENFSFPILSSKAKNLANSHSQRHNLSHNSSCYTDCSELLGNLSGNFENLNTENEIKNLISSPKSCPKFMPFQSHQTPPVFNPKNAQHRAFSPILLPDNTTLPNSRTQSAFTSKEPTLTDIPTRLRQNYYSESKTLESSQNTPIMRKAITRIKNVKGEECNTPLAKNKPTMGKVFKISKIGEQPVLKFDGNVRSNTPTLSKNRTNSNSSSISATSSHKSNQPCISTPQKRFPLLDHFTPNYNQFDVGVSQIYTNSNNSGDKTNNLTASGNGSSNFQYFSCHNPSGIDSPYFDSIGSHKFICSSNCSNTPSSKVDSDLNGLTYWTIDQLAVIDPKTIDESNGYLKQFNYILSPSKEKLQIDKLRNFFKSNSQVFQSPSPNRDNEHLHQHPVYLAVLTPSSTRSAKTNYSNDKSDPSQSSSRPFQSPYLSSSGNCATHHQDNINHRLSSQKKRSRNDSIGLISNDDTNEMEISHNINKLDHKIESTTISGNSLTQNSMINNTKCSINDKFNRSVESKNKLNKVDPIWFYKQILKKYPESLPKNVDYSWLNSILNSKKPLGIHHENTPKKKNSINNTHNSIDSIDLNYSSSRRRRLFPEGYDSDIENSNPLQISSQTDSPDIKNISKPRLADVCNWQATPSSSPKKNQKTSFTIEKQSSQVGQKCLFDNDSLSKFDMSPIKSDSEDSLDEKVNLSSSNFKNKSPIFDISALDISNDFESSSYQDAKENTSSSNFNNRNNKNPFADFSFNSPTCSIETTKNRRGSISGKNVDEFLNQSIGISPILSKHVLKIEPENVESAFKDVVKFKKMSGLDDSGSSGEVGNINLGILRGNNDGNTNTKTSKQSFAVTPTSELNLMSIETTADSGRGDSAQGSSVIGFPTKSQLLKFQNESQDQWFDAKSQQSLSNSYLGFQNLASSTAININTNPKMSIFGVSQVGNTNQDSGNPPQTEAFSFEGGLEGD